LVGCTYAPLGKRHPLCTPCTCSGAAPLFSIALMMIGGILRRFGGVGKRLSRNCVRIGQSALDCASTAHRGPPALFVVRFLVKHTHSAARGNLRVCGREFSGR
jgi:hypothetical protein